VIIQSLCKYYDILSNDEECDIPKLGYSRTKVSAALVISKDGKLVDIISLKIESSTGKKLVAKNIIVPEQQKRSGSSAPSYFMCDNIQYVLGFDKGDNIKEKQFKDFKAKHNKILSSATSKTALAVLNFINSWNVNNALHNPIIIDNFKTLLDGNLVFRLDGEFEFAHKNKEIINLWEKNNSPIDDPTIEQCLITGEYLEIERIHNSIKPLFMQKGKQPSPNGWTIVAVDKDSTAFDSYDKKQSYNSPISKKSAFAYTTVLNYMLTNSKQKIQIGDATTVFWAESPSNLYSDLAMQLFNPEVVEDTDEVTSDSETQRLISDVLESARLGNKIPMDIYKGINPLTKFYVLGLSPNASRVSVRFFHSDTFGGFVEKVTMHYRDMEIVKEYENNRTNIPIRWLVAETISPKSSEKEAKPLLAGAIMRSILNGGMYPQSLYNSILQRVRTDSEIRVNYIRASIIKASLSRKARITKNKIIEEVLTVALNEKTTEKSYLLGRLFAILEKTQKDSGNETIRSRYFASAMTTPGAVFPLLLRLAQHHISKVKFGFLNDKKIEAILNDIERFPSHLSLDEQGIFILGYYHQRPKLWEKQIKENQNEGEN